MNDGSLSPPLIEVSNVSKFYEQTNTWALQNVDLQVARGECVAIIGPSGCGKSTLLNLIGAIDRPTSGTICYAGQKLMESLDEDHYRSRKVGFVFQSFYLLPALNVLENVQIPTLELGLRNRQRVELAQAALEKVGLSSKWNQRPSTLSGGERQRTAIARAIINVPEVLLADEPTGNLDSTNSEAVLELFSTLCENTGLTLLMVTHDSKVARRAQRIVSMKDGVIISANQVSRIS
jgi:ABC-type lipoprotein export system ATPase subunit